LGPLQVELVVVSVIEDSEPNPQEDDFAWHVHATIDAWTGKVDTKASIVLAIESAVFGFVVTLSRGGGEFDSLEGSSQCWFGIGLGFLLLAVVLALLAVIPQLNRRKTQQNWQTNTIYFGHLRHWEPQALARRLADAADHREQLAEQLVAMSKIAWRKHVWLQCSLVALTIGAGILLAVATTS
jgi:hypothetical protein